MDYDNGNLLLMPKDVDIARIGGKDSETYDELLFTQFNIAFVDREQPQEFHGKTTGHTIHAHCWVLLDRMLNIMSSKTKLQAFVRAAQRYWKTHPTLIPGTIHGYVKGLWFPGSELALGPLILPEIQRAITFAIEYANDIKSDPYFHFTNLPMDIRILIVELLCPMKYRGRDVQNTRNMLWAFEWIIPTSFWVARVDEKLLFELDSVDKTDSVTWQCLCLELMPFLCDRGLYNSSGLENRRRVQKLIARFQREESSLL